MGFETGRKVCLLLITEDFTLIQQTVFKDASFMDAGLEFFGRRRGHHRGICREEGSNNAMAEGASNSESNSIFNALPDRHLWIGCGERRCDFSRRYRGWLVGYTLSGRGLPRHFILVSYKIVCLKAISILPGV